MVTGSVAEADGAKMSTDKIPAVAAWASLRGNNFMAFFTLARVSQDRLTKHLVKPLSAVFPANDLDSMVALGYESMKNADD